jgi:hypothetical protein
MPIMGALKTASTVFITLMCLNHGPRCRRMVSIARFAIISFRVQSKIAGSKMAGRAGARICDSIASFVGCLDVPVRGFEIR